MPTFVSQIKHKMFLKKRQMSQGFTLLETLVAIFILTLALTGPIYIASLAIRSSVESRDNISAYHLAEEAIEVIRNKRDTISLQPGVDQTNWLYGITGGENCLNPFPAIDITSCYMNRDTDGVYSFTQCPSGGCPALTFTPAGEVLYGQTGSSDGIDSKFRREIYLQVAPYDGSTSVPVHPNREVDVVVTVRWLDRGRERQFQIIERLHNQNYAKYYIEDTTE